MTEVTGDEVRRSRDGGARREWRHGGVPGGKEILFHPQFRGEREVVREVQGSPGTGRRRQAVGRGAARGRERSWGSVSGGLGHLQVSEEEVDELGGWSSWLVGGEVEGRVVGDRVADGRISLRRLRRSRWWRSRVCRGVRLGFVGKGNMEAGVWWRFLRKAKEPATPGS